MSLKTVTSSIRGGHVTTVSGRENPFPGARPFTPAESKWFYGRRDEVAELVSLVRAQQFCVLYAPSGAGKSSLINAGVLAMLGYGDESGDHAEFVGGFDVVGVAKVHPSAVRGATGWPDRTQVPNVYVTAALNTLAKDKRSPHLTFDAYFKGRPRHFDEFDDAIPLLLVLDQFEEILEPFGRDDWLECRDDFFAQLDAAMRRDPSLHILVSIREDHLATLERLTANMATVCQARYRLDRLTRPRAQQAIEVPALKTGLPFEEGVVKDLLDDLALLRIDQFPAPVPDEFIDPGQLQVVCNRLWAKADADPSNATGNAGASIGAKHVEEAGGVEGSLQKYYDEAVSSVAKGRVEQRIRHFFEHRLITAHGTRQLVPLDPTAARTYKAPHTVLDKLESEYGLVRKERRGGTSYWELSHDGFIQPIRRANGEIQKHRSQKMMRAMYAGAIPAYIFLMVMFLDVFDTGGSPTEDSVTVEQFVVSSQGAANATVEIGQREGNSSMVVELVKPTQIAATFLLQVDEENRVEPVSVSGDSAEFELPRTTRYRVVVSPGPLVPGLAVNVRPDAVLVDLPPVLGRQSGTARELLTEAELVVSAIRPGCTPVPNIREGAVVRLIDLDRQAVAGVDGVQAGAGVDGVIAEIGAEGGARKVATGTTLAVEVFDERFCTARQSIW